MLDALKSLYMICLSDECRKARPRAAPMAIFILVLHESGSNAAPPAQRFVSKKPDMIQCTMCVTIIIKKKYVI